MVCYVCLPSEQPRKKLSLSAPPQHCCLLDPLQMFPVFYDPDGQIGCWNCTNNRDQCRADGRPDSRQEDG